MRTKLLFTFIFLAVCFLGFEINGQEKTPVDVSGEWSITITFIRGVGHHTAIINQDGERLFGVYKGEIKEGDLRGSVTDNTVDFTGSLKHESTGVSFHYTGTIEGNTMKGKVEMGEYWSAEWTAERIVKKKK